MGKFFGKIWHFVLSKKFYVIVGLLIIGGVGYFAFSKKENTETISNKAQTTIVERGDISVSVSGSGQVFAKSQVDIRPQVAGDGLDVEQVLVKNDQVVKKGDLIAVLDSKDSQKEIRDAELALRSAEIKLKETENSYENKTVEDKWARQLQEITFSQSSNRLADSKEDLQDYSIEAPFDGVVTNLSVAVGDSIARDEILASVITKEMFAEISLNEVDAIKIKEGNTAELTFDALDGVKATGVVTKMDTIGTVEQSVVYFKAEISIDNPNALLKPGMSVSANIGAELRENILMVPVSALKTNANKNYLSVASGIAMDTATPENVSMKQVETGITDGVYIEIISGVKEGDIIVTKSESASLGNSGIEKEGANSILGGAVRVQGTGGGMRR